MTHTLLSPVIPLYSAAAHAYAANTKQQQT